MAGFWIVFGGGGVLGFMGGWCAKMQVHREQQMMLKMERADFIYDREVWEAKTRHPAYRGRVMGR